jgi:hypothetical protein
MLDKEKYRTKKYLHFDHRTRIENAECYITNPAKIAKHSFLPLIHYVSSFERCTGEKDSEFNNRPIKTKSRDILYAGHWDNFIYKYYAEILNDKYYNGFCFKFGIDECVTAYRNNKAKQSNIDFAAEIINQIVEYGEAYILVGDFTNYFGRIDHTMLKDNLKKIFGVSKLSDDWFNVYRSITKYGYYDKSFIEKIIGTDKSLRSQKKKSYFNQLSDFRSFQKEHKTKFNDNDYGIPQGTAISAIFANVYAIEFDIKLKQIADKYLGKYRRYSDDFILVIPKQKITKTQEFRDIEIHIRKLALKYKISIQEKKTGLYVYKKRHIDKLDDPDIHHLDYLGFIFDGETVKMRGKSPYKFYRKAKQLILLSHKRKEQKQLEKLPYRKSIYRLYTDLGETKRGCNSFIDYAKKAQRKFDQLSPNTQNMMMVQIKNRKKKIEKLLGLKIHT